MGLKLMEFYASKVDGVLIAVDDDSAEKMSSLGLDTIVKCTCNKNRNYENHKRFFKFLEIAFGMQKHFTNREHFRKWLIMKAGYYDAIVSPKGHTIFAAKSIAYESIEEEEFKILFKKCVATMVNEFSLSLTFDEFWQLCDFE